jgi:subtilase family serine protease
VKVDNAVQDVIDNRRALVLSMSFGYCEINRTVTYVQSQRALAQKANSEGITWIAASGDAGPSNCDQHTAQAATQGLSASFPATIPEVTGVGGTKFNESSGTFWSTMNSPTGGSALGYIPEIAWNEFGSTGLFSSGGGPSTLFLKPSWQTGLGVPNDSARDTPDVALKAAKKSRWVLDRSQWQPPGLRWYVRGDTRVRRDHNDLRSIPCGGRSALRFIEHKSDIV